MVRIGRARRPIVFPIDCSNCSGPERWWKVRFKQDSSCIIRDAAHSALCLAIGVWFCPHGELAPDPTSLQTIIELSASPASFLVIMKDLYLVPSGKLSSSFECPECFGSLILAVHEVGKPVVGAVIHKGSPVSVTLRSSNRHRPMQVTMYNLKWDLGLVLRLLVDMSVLPPSNAGFA